MQQANTPLAKKQIDLVIFDCDGVLIDSENLSKRVLLLMLKNLGVDASDAYFDKYFLGHSYESVKAQILADYAVTLSSDFRQDYQQKLMQVFAQELRSTSQLQWMLEQLKIPRCVATSSSPERVKFALNVTQLSDYFPNCVYTASEVKHGKPAPDLFLHAAEKMGTAPENCLVIEDSSAGIKAALAAKMPVIRYAGASHFKDKIAELAQDNIDTILEWSQLYELMPALKVQCRNERQLW